VKKLLGLGTVFVLVLACVGAVSALNLVANGDFESPVATPPFQTLSGNALNGWTIESGSIDLINGYWSAASGQQSIDLEGNAPATISQELSTKDGETCTLKFWIAGNKDQPGKKTVTVDWGTGTAGTFDFTATASGGMGWEEKTVTGLIATGPTVIKFVDATEGGTAFGPALDDISVECTSGNTPIPEFPSIALPAALIVGILGAVLFIQKSKEQ